MADEYNLVIEINSKGRAVIVEESIYGRPYMPGKSEADDLRHKAALDLSRVFEQVQMNDPKSQQNREIS